MHKPRIHLVATGGTIAGAGARPGATASYQAAVLGVAELCESAPGLDVRARISAEQFASINSKDAAPAFWQSLAARLQAVLDDPDVAGVVVTHGTDTLEESAYYLNLVLKSAKPVVLVGAMRPATALSADGPLNLLNAVTVAAHPQAQGRGVLVAMNHLVLGAREAAKLDTQRPDAFGAPNAGPLGLVHEDNVAWLANTSRPHTLATPFTPETKLPRVDILSAYPGFPSSLIQSVRSSGAQGLVWAGTGNGTASEEAETELAAATAAGLTIVRASRVPHGLVMPGDDAKGQTWAGTLSPWKARILLMLALGAGHTTQAAIQGVFDEY